MEIDQAKFEGWARVEVMGHQSHIGYVTTQAFGAAVLFRVDQPEIPETEETLDEPAWIGNVRAQPGSVVRREAVPAASVLLGAGSIYRIVPCDEAMALKAIRSSQNRPLFIVRLAELPSLPALPPVGDDPDSDYDDEEAEHSF